MPVPTERKNSTLRDTGFNTVDVVIDPDRISRSLSLTALESIRYDAGREAIRLFRQSIAERKSISFESTLTGQTVLNRMAEAKEAGYEVDLRYVAL